MFMAEVVKGNWFTTILSRLLGKKMGSMFLWNGKLYI